jgi:hypothetical protein
LLSEQKTSSQDSFNSLAIFLPSTMFDSQVFSIISPLVFSEIDNPDAIDLPYFVDDVIASWKVVQATIASLSLKKILLSASSITRE